MIFKFLTGHSEHPLDDPKELRRIVGELPLDSPAKAVDEIDGWLDSLLDAEDIRLDRRFEIVRVLDEAAQPQLRRLARDYLNPPAPAVSANAAKSEERQLWSINHGYWERVGALYASCLEIAAVDAKGRGSEAFRSSLPLAAARCVAARATQIKWIAFHNELVPEALWMELGAVYLSAEIGGYAQKSLQLYPQQSANTSVLHAYLQALILHSSSIDALLPVEIEIAERIVQRFLPSFVFSARLRPDSVYWVDAAAAAPPSRLARNPHAIKPSLRFFSAGDVAPALQTMIRQVEHGELPADLNLGGQYPGSVLLPVMSHLARYWAPRPPLRDNQRHPVRTRMAVRNGFGDCFTVFAGGEQLLGIGRRSEHWSVENVSLGGFGALVDGPPGDWLRVGALLALQPDGGDNWLLALIGRYSKDAGGRPRIGIRTLARHPVSVELRPRASALAAIDSRHGIWLRDADSGEETRFVLPLGSFNVREELEFMHEGVRFRLTPVELEELGHDFEITRYRLRREG